MGKTWKEILFPNSANSTQQSISTVNEGITVEVFSLDQATSKVDESTKTVAKVREFRKLYENDGITFAYVNYLISHIVTKFIFIGDSNVVKALEKWGSDKYFKRILEDIALDMILGGTAWTEPIWSSIDLETVKVINPSTMDFIRDNDGNVVYDDELKPVGYVQDRYGRIRTWYKDKIVEGSDILFKSKNGQDLRDKIQRYKIVGYGDSELGISLIQPSYRSAIIRTNVEDMVGEAGYRGAGMVAYVEGELPADVKKALVRDMQKIKSKNAFVFNKRIQLANIPIPDLASGESLIYLLSDIQACGYGIASDAVLAGGKSYKTDLGLKLNDQEGRIDSYQDRFAEQINTNIIYPLIEKLKIKGSARIQFNPTSPASQLNRARSIATLARRNLMTYDPELEMHIRKELKLPINLLDKKFKEWKKAGGPPQSAIGDGSINPSENQGEDNEIPEEDVDNKSTDKNAKKL